MLKHNKKKNAGIVYEQLISLITRLAAENKKDEANFVLEMVKKYFSPKTELGKERKLIASLTSKEGLPKDMGKSVLGECISEAKTINTEKLEREKVLLVNEISKKLGGDVFKIPLKEYKYLASIQILFNEEREGYKHTTPKERVQIKEEILKHLSLKPVKENVLVDNFTMKILLEKFNKKYEKLINENQKTLLSHWVKYLVSSNDKDIKNFITEKAKEISKTLSTIENNEQNKEFHSMIVEANEKLKETIRETKIDNNTVNNMMLYFDLCEDLALLENGANEVEKNG